MRRRVVMAAAFLVLLAGCSMPGTKIYSLALPEEKSAQPVPSPSPLNITISSPRYLEQSFIAYRTSPYEIDIARYSRWDMPPSDLVLGAFREAMASSGLFSDVKTFMTTPPGYQEMEIGLKRFEREDEDGASFARILIDVRLLSPEGAELYSGAMSERVRLKDNSFLELARTLSESLSGSLSQMKEDLQARRSK